MNRNGTRYNCFHGYQGDIRLLRLVVTWFLESQDPDLDDFYDRRSLTLATERLLHQSMEQSLLETSNR